MEKKAVLFISPQPFFERRGSPIRVKFNLLALGKADYRVDLLTLPVGADVVLPNTTVHRVSNPFGWKNVPIGPGPKKLFFDLLILIRAFSLCKRSRYVLIHGVEEAGTLAVFLAKLFRTRAIFEKHSDPLSYKRGLFKSALMKIYAKVERWTAGKAHAVIGTGQGLVDQVRSMRPEAAVYHIPDIASSVVDGSAEAAAEIRRAIGAQPEDVVILYAGSFASYQGVDLLFDAVHQVVAKVPKARFVVIGGKKSENAERLKQLEEANVSGSVYFAGSVDTDKLPGWLMAADILLSPRISGVNSPLKVLDYLKSGRAIVATDVPANRLLLDEELACFAQPDASAFAEQISRVAVDPELRAKLGKAGKLRFESQYTLDKHRERLSHCYRETLEKPRRKIRKRTKT
ncbi:MAG: glycosyltransferase [Puniceicoccaceae bacterium]